MNVLGFSTRLDMTGKQHVWRLVLERDGNRHQILIALPKGPNWLNEPVDPVFGDLQAGYDHDKTRAILSCILDKQYVVAHHNYNHSPFLKGIDIDWINTPIGHGNDQADEEIRSLKEAVS